MAAASGPSIASGLASYAAGLATANPRGTHVTVESIPVPATTVREYAPSQPHGPPPLAHHAHRDLTCSSSTASVAGRRSVVNCRHWRRERRPPASRRRPPPSGMAYYYLLVGSLPNYEL